MVGDDVVVVGEFFVADRALPILLHNLEVEKLPISEADLSSRYPLG